MQEESSEILPSNNNKYLNKILIPHFSNGNRKIHNFKEKIWNKNMFFMEKTFQLMSTISIT